MAPPRRISREDVLAKVAAVFSGEAAPSMAEMAVAAGVSRAALYALFGSRAALLDAMGAEVPPSIEERILTAGGELLAERGLGGLSLDEVANRSGVSRATVYRLYPGKAALFRQIVITYLPVEATLELMETTDQPPTRVMPMLAAGLAQAGHVRIGILRCVLFETTREAEEGSEEVFDEVVRSVGVILGYLERQMDAGRLRRMEPVLAMQAFLAPVMLHAVSRPVLEQTGLVTVSLEQAVNEFTEAWLRAMAPSRRKG